MPDLRARSRPARMLRSSSGGRLKSQLIDGEEFPVFLFAGRETGARWSSRPSSRDSSTRALLIGLILGSAPETARTPFFAVGLEHGNSTIGNTVMNIVFLREHNRSRG